MARPQTAPCGATSFKKATHLTARTLPNRGCVGRTYRIFGISSYLPSLKTNILCEKRRHRSARRTSVGCAPGSSSSVSVATDDDEGSPCARAGSASMKPSASSNSPGSWTYEKVKGRAVNGLSEKRTDESVTGTP